MAEPLQVAGHFGTDKQEEARERLATAIMSVAGADNTDPQVLRNMGLEAVARAYPDLAL